MQTNKATIFVFLIVLLFTSFLMMELFWVFITPIVLALVLTSIFYPFYLRVLNLCFGHRHLAAFLSIVIIVLVVSIPLSVFITSLTKQALLFYQSSKTSGLYNNFLAEFSDQHPLILKLKLISNSFGLDISAENIIATVSQIVGSFSHMLYKSLSELPTNALALVFNFIITIILVYTFMITGADFKNYLREISPLPVDEEERLSKQFSEISKAVFVGNVLVAILEGIFGGVAFLIFGLGSGLFWGVVIALASFLPIVSAFIVVIPATFVVWIQSGPTHAIAYLIFNSIYLAILELVVKTKLIGGKSRLNAVLVLLSVLGGIQLFGVLGVFYGPLVVTMFLTLIEIYKEHYKEPLLKTDKT